MADSPALAGGAAITPAVLGRAGTQIRSLLSDEIARLHPDLAAAARYHCGIGDQYGQAIGTGGSKMLRPALVLLAASIAEALAAGGHPPSAPSRAVVAGAGAVQLVHEFSLLHDDIMDGDRMRRGRPTAWTVYGIDTALLAGVALLALAMSLLTDHVEAGAILAGALVRLCAVQADELAAHQPCSVVTMSDWERMAAGKTSALFTASCEMGALLAGGDSRIAAALAAVGSHLGLAFQATDDWLGIWGDTDVTGKPVGADIAARKRSLPIASALTSSHATAPELTAILTGDGELTMDDVKKVTMLLEHAHADWFTRSYARKRITQASAAILALCPPPDVWKEWADLVSYLTVRAA